jgi:tRNA/rRNA methyltransferase
MAVHGLPLLQAAPVLPTLAAAIADCGRVVAASGRTEGSWPAPVPPPQALGWLLGGAQDREPAALVFGREDRGLSTDELLQAGRVLQIATAADHPSLNLSHAVAVVLHELQGLRGAAPAADPLPEPCPRSQIEAALADAEALLLEVGFLHPHTAHARMARVRALLQRAQPDRREVALLRGMVRQLRWATRRLSPPADAS